MRALVTGATGFIGGALAAALSEQGWEVSLLVHPTSRERLAQSEPPGCQAFIGSLDRPDPALQDAVAGCQVIFHAAAIRNRWGTTPQDYYQTNVEGTRRLLEAAHCQPGSEKARFVYISSVGVFGYPGVEGIDENFPLQSWEGKLDYHHSKAQAEEVVRAYAGALETVIVRPTITYGPGDRDGMITRLIDMVARRRFLGVGRGQNHIHLTYIDDLVQGLLLAGVHPAAVGETFILAGPHSIAVSALVAQIQTALGHAPRSVAWFVPVSLARGLGWGLERTYRLAGALDLALPGGEPFITGNKVNLLCKHRSFSNRKAALQLGFAPRVQEPEGIEKTIQWMVAEGQLARPLRRGSLKRSEGGSESCSSSPNPTEVR